MNWTFFHSKDTAADHARQAATPATADTATQTPAMTDSATRLTAEARHEAEMQKLIYEDDMPA